MDIKDVKRTAIPSGYLMDLDYLGSIEIAEEKKDIQIYRDNHIFFLEAEKIVIATYPKGAKLEDSIIVHPRYANEKYFELIEVKGFRNGRTIDILSPGYHNGESCKILNIKGVGASADGEHMVIDNERWYVGDRSKWKPLAEAQKESLGRRWGLLSKEAGEEEYNYNVFAEKGIEQIPHLKLNYAPEGILPFKNVAQLVRGLNTNIRCDSGSFEDQRLQKYVNIKSFSTIDAKIFFAQKELFKENQVLTGLGKVANNRYIDGRLTDMENYIIKETLEEDKRIHLAYSFCLDLMGSAFIAMRKYAPGRKKYLEQLAEKTGIPVDKYTNFAPKIFMEYLLPSEFGLSEAVERAMLVQVFKEDFAKFLKN